MRRTLGEMRCQNKILFVGILLMLITLAFMAFTESHEEEIDIVSTHFEETSRTERLVDSFNITQMSYGFILNLYPIINGMKKSQQTAGNVRYAVTTSIAFCFLAHIALAVLALMIYGNRIEVNILDNFAKESSVGSVIVQLTFLTIFLSNTPFFFLPGKYFLLNIVFEARERLFSRQLQK